MMKMREPICNYEESIFAAQDLQTLIGHVSGASGPPQVDSAIATLPYVDCSRPLPDIETAALTEQEINEILFPELSGDAFVSIRQVDQQDDYVPQVFDKNYSTNMVTTLDFSELEPPQIPGQTLLSTRTASGLAPEHEFTILREFATLGHVQLPIVDIDLIFLRYRFSVPAPLPRFLTLTLLACGANYSSRRVARPCIDGSRAQQIFDDAKSEILAVAVKDLTVDAISALMLMSFHWNGEITSYERRMLASLSVQKIQSLKLNTNVGMYLGRTKREVGVLKFLVWLNFIVDAFSGSQGPAVGDLEVASMPYNGLDIELDPLNLEDTEAMHIEYLTGVPRPNWTDEKAKRNLVFHRAFAGVAKLQNTAVRLQRSGCTVQHLVHQLEDWEVSSFPVCDLTQRRWDHSVNGFEHWDTLTPGMISLNFSYWYCALNIYFDGLRHHLNVQSLANGTSSHNARIDDAILHRRSVDGCTRAFTSMISIFEVLYRANYIRQLSQVLRGQLYFGGRILQVFYRNGICADGRPVVNRLLLSRWEKCLELAEQVWGYSSRGIELSLMNLDDPG